MTPDPPTSFGKRRRVVECFLLFEQTEWKVYTPNKYIKLGKSVFIELKPKLYYFLAIFCHCVCHWTWKLLTIDHLLMVNYDYHYHYFSLWPWPCPKPTFTLTIAKKIRDNIYIESGQSGIKEIKRCSDASESCDLECLLWHSGVELNERVTSWCLWTWVYLLCRMVLLALMIEI